MWSSQGEVLSCQRAYRRREPRRLIEDIVSLCDEATLSLADLQRIVVDVGPGTFTGIRAGLATARALAYAHDLETIGVSSHELMWRDLHPEGLPARVVQPSRSGWCFVSDWPLDSALSAPNLREVELVKALDQLGSDVSVIGPETIFENFTHLEPKVCAHPHARAAALAVSGRHGSDWSTIVPLYVALSDAERNLGIEAEHKPIHAEQRS